MSSWQVTLLWKPKNPVVSAPALKLRCNTQAVVNVSMTTSPAKNVTLNCAVLSIPLASTAMATMLARIFEVAAENVMLNCSVLRIPFASTATATTCAHLFEVAADANALMPLPRRLHRGKLSAYEESAPTTLSPISSMALTILSMGTASARKSYAHKFPPTSTLGISFFPRREVRLLSSHQESDPSWLISGIPVDGIGKSLQRVHFWCWCRKRFRKLGSCLVRCV